MIKIKKTPVVSISHKRVSENVSGQLHFNQDGVSLYRRAMNTLPSILHAAAISLTPSVPKSIDQALMSSLNTQRRYQIFAQLG